MLPRFDERGQLPPGIHQVAWAEFESAFGYNRRRRALVRGLHRVLMNLKRAGCRAAYIDGSFVTQEPDPRDYDACWDAAHVDKALVDPVLFDFTGRRRSQKLKYGGELFPEPPPAGGQSMLDYFQRDRSGNAKGIVMIRLGDLHD